jgi:hypothetical protein
VWNTDTNGNYISGATGAVSGSDPTLEALEPSFQQDLNGDGTIGVPAVAAYSGGSFLHNLLISNAQPSLAIDPSQNTASANAGLSAPALSFIGTPDAITLGSNPTFVDYNLEPSSGIETVANFILGQDRLNIDLAGAPNTILKAFDTTVGGVHAVAFASSADIAHGIVLLNLSPSLTAADLLGSHTTFGSGSAFVT